MSETNRILQQQNLIVDYQKREVFENDNPRISHGSLTVVRLTKSELREAMVLNATYRYSRNFRVYYRCFYLSIVSALITRKLR